MNFRKSLIASSIASASAAMTPLIANAVTISTTINPSFTSQNLDATNLLITNTGLIDLSSSSFQFSAVTVPGFGSLTADIDIDAGGGISAVAPGTTNNPTGIRFNTQAILTGTITNNGTITAENAGIVMGDGASLIGNIVNGGTITGNSGGLTGQAAINIEQTNFQTTAGFTSRPVVNGSITNSGTIEGLVNANGIELRAGEVTGSIDNATGGSITSAGDAAILIDSAIVGAGISNDGTISGSSGIVIIDTSAEPLAVFNGGISNTANGIITGEGGIEVGVGANFTGGINNAGTITATEQDFAAIDIYSDVSDAVVFETTFSGDITNSGTIQNTFAQTATEAAPGIWLSAVTMTGSIVNTSTGTISSPASAAILLEGFQASTTGFTTPDTVLTGSITNSGTISGGSAVVMRGSNVNSVDNNAGGMISGTLLGLGIDSVRTVVDISGSTVGTAEDAGLINVTGSITNNGTIASTADTATLAALGQPQAGALYLSNAATVGGDIVNGATGTISAEGASALVLGASGGQVSVAGDIDNSGDISSASATAVLLNNNSIVTGGLNNAAGATIDGADGGVIVFSATLTGGISNAGTISSLGPNAGGNNAYGVDIQNANVGAIDNTGTITGGFILEQSTMTGDFSNAGTLQSAAAGGSAYVMRGVNSTQGDLINTGSISSSDEAGVLVEQGAVLANIDNSGEITGATAAIGVLDGSSSIGTITNNAGGTITGGTFGAISALNGGVIGTVINDGTIAGTTDFGAGGGNFINDGTAGAVTGASTVTNGGTIGDVVLVATGGTFGNTGGSAGDVFNAIGTVSNAGVVGDIDFVGTNNTFLNADTAGNINNVNLVTNLGGDIGDIVFESGLTAVYSSVGNTNVGSIDGVDAIQVLQDGQSAGVSTATVNGNLTFGGLLTVQATGSASGINQHSQLAVSGDADVTGANVFVIATGIDLFTMGDKFTFLSASGTLTSNISDFTACDIDLDTGCETPLMSITDNSEVLDFNVVQQDNELIAVIGEVDFTPTLPPTGGGNTGSGNTNNVATSLNAVVQSNSGSSSFSSSELGQVVNALANIDASTPEGQRQYAVALSSLDADTVEGGSLSALEADTVAASTIDNRTAALRGYYGISGAVAGDPLGINGFWVQGYDNETDQGVRDDVDGFDADTYGVALGIDAPVGERIIVGAAFSYADTEVDMKNTSPNGLEIDSYRLAAYGSYNADTFYLDGQVAYALNDYESKRAISPLLSATPLVAKGQHDGDQYNFRLRGGYPIATASGLYVTPVAEMNYTYLKEDSYTETGAGNASLRISSDDVEVLVLAVGAKLAYPVTTANEVTWIPELSLTYAYDTIGDEVEVDSNFVGVTGAAFITNGASIEQEAFKAGLKLRAFGQGNFSFAASYDYVDKQHYDSQSITATVRYDF